MMRQLTKMLPALLIVGCGVPTIPDTEIPDTKESREVVDFLERYRSAVEARDAETLRGLASSHYYENASTTWQSKDDWGAPELDEVLAKFKEHVKIVTYEITLKDLRIFGQRADVDFEHTWAFQYTDGERDAWTKKTDQNRLELIKEDGAWRILSGM
jgi:hypothetical protein